MAQLKFGRIVNKGFKSLRRFGRKAAREWDKDSLFGFQGRCGTTNRSECELIMTQAFILLQAKTLLILKDLLIQVHRRLDCILPKLHKVIQPMLSGQTPGGNGLSSGHWEIQATKDRRKQIGESCAIQTQGNPNSGTYPFCGITTAVDEAA